MYPALATFSPPAECRSSNPIVFSYAEKVASGETDTRLGAEIGVAIASPREALHRFNRR
jgi:hypothetical protein